MRRLFDAYRAFHEQAFIPIFVHDHFDSLTLLDACLEAGVKGIEYTLRRSDADTMIPWIRQNYPKLYLLVGSTQDDESIVRKAQARYPQLRTIAELDAMGVDGFVSMIGFSTESIKRYSPRRLVIPTAMTVNEAFFQVGAGAHFAKMLGPNLNLVKTCRGEPTFGFCPILVTGGMNLERIPKAMNAGAMVIGSGFDLILKGQPSDISAKGAAKLLKQYLEVTQGARAKKWPEMARAIGGDARTWLDSLPHHHPF